MIVTIDGPAGSGKSTTARLVAQRLGFKYIDTGATYRAVAFGVVERKIDPKDKRRVEDLSSTLDIDFKGDRVFLSGKDITEVIKDEEIGKIASLCSTYKGVREKMVALQRRLAREGNIICEGRDIGTVVFPHAKIKIYMDASIKERAKRRMLELKERGKCKSQEEIERDLKLRDKQDRTRKYAPLRIPKGAIIIDTTNLSIEEEVEEVIKIIKNETKV
jgi:cytidylate kinase